MASAAPLQPFDAPEPLPPLREGDRLDQPTFHARYEAMPEHVHAELIGGIVYMASPVMRLHMRHVGLVVHWLTAYEDATPGVEALGSGTLILDDENEPEPDAMLRVLPECGGRSRDEGGYVRGLPELLVEVSESTEAKDLGKKMPEYQEAGVEEFLIVLLRRRQVRWYRLDERGYRELLPDGDGIVRSERFPGLWLDTQALLRGASRGLMEVVSRGIDSPEHLAFVDAMTARHRGDDGPA